VSIRFVEQETKNKKVVVNIEQNTKHTYEYGDKCDDDDCFFYHSWRNNVVIAF